MPTIFTHAAIPLLTGAALGQKRISRRLLATAAIAAMLPDADVLGFRFHIPYASAFGHRGAMHSLAFGLVVALLAMLWHRHLHTRAVRAFVCVAIAALSHPLLDMLTDGGQGVALAWPWSTDRWFFPWQPIHVSPIGARFFSARSLPVIGSELLWVWLPVGLLALAIWFWCKRRDDGSTQQPAAPPPSWS
ncbi:metal-dependent hydrolase [Dyella agri]|uniref:Metal-dependent hydrolase n=1 Tax=Dyella agri TaxID=1926869 RepID=A0ABW8KJ10_9GAMM